MKTQNIPLLGMERFKQHPQLVNYMDDNIAVIESLSEMIEMDEKSVKLDCFILIFCMEGEITTVVNGQQHVLQKDHCAILPMGTIIRRSIISQQFTAKIIAASRSFIGDVLCMNKETFDIFHYLYHYPIHPVKMDVSYKMYLYKELAITLLQEEQHIYSRQTRRFHFGSMFCEMMAQLSRIIPEHHRKGVQSNRAVFIVRDFMELVNADDGTHRSVHYYADRLCYTPKYLCATVKGITGKTPLEIITEHTIKEIKYKLKHSEMTMIEMAYHFNFSNPSFFGKYVKANIGMTPLQYRLSEEKE